MRIAVIIKRKILVFALTLCIAVIPRYFCALSSFRKNQNDLSKLTSLFQTFELLNGVWSSYCRPLLSKIGTISLERFIVATPISINWMLLAQRKVVMWVRRRTRAICTLYRISFRRITQSIKNPIVCFPFCWFLRRIPIVMSFIPPKRRVHCL